MRRKRLFPSLLLAAAIAPATWLRSPSPQEEFDSRVAIERLDIAAARAEPFELAGAWELSGDQVRFGGFSALVALHDGRFLAGSDSGARLVFDRPDRTSATGTLSLIGNAEAAQKIGNDLESLALDQDSGTLWGAYEQRNEIVRFDADFVPGETACPDAMSGWGSNSGPEAFTRMADGRFIAIEEQARDWFGSLHRALLFRGDPVEGAEPDTLTVSVPGGYRPVDMVALDDKRALVLLRRIDWGLPPGFQSAIGLLGIGKEEADKPLDVQLIAELGGGFPHDNYEGIAITGDADGRHIWLISDDNFMRHQRTLLLKLRWMDGTHEKARR